MSVDHAMGGDGHRPARASRPQGRLALCLTVLMVCASGMASAGGEGLPPSPYDILEARPLATPVLDAVPVCVPADLDPALDPVVEEARARDWQLARALLNGWVRGLDHVAPELVVFGAVLDARSASTRDGQNEAERVLARFHGQREFQALTYCTRVERARLLLLMGRAPEAAAQLARARSWLDRYAPGETLRPSHVEFWEAELFFQTGRSFEAHLAFQELAHSESPSIVLASRLRLADLSFDAGRIDRVSDEYEALLPRATAFGASTGGWALRAAEAALDAGQTARARDWLDRFSEEGRAHESWEAAEIRRADLDVRSKDLATARRRLAAISAQGHDRPTGALAAIRAVDLGVYQGSPDQRLDLLLLSVRHERAGVRRYALDVLMDELEARGDVNAALAVATRLAYEGSDPGVTPDFVEKLDRLLEAGAKGARDADGCRGIVNALGGRFGILIERATRPDAFIVVGECFEQMELPWLAANLYRSVARRFGVAGAERIALPLARVSLSVGDVALARRVATSAIEDGTDGDRVWKAIVAEADFVGGDTVKAIEGLRAALEPMQTADALLRASRGRLLRMLASTLAETPDAETADLVAKRASAWIAEGDTAPRARADLVEAALLTAHAYRRAGRVDDAHRLYRVVDAEAGAGALQSSARFWLGLAGAKRAGGAPAWGIESDLGLGSPWSRYAQFERRLAGLMAAYGEGE